jgi:CHAT domain-containing protein/tetratricopeptide (TPR) repeat protein
MMTKFLVHCISIIVLCLFMTRSAASTEGTSHSPEDVRAEIAHLIEDAKDAFGKLAIVDLDTGIARMDTAITLATEYFGPNDTTIATVLTWQSLLYAWKMDFAKCESLVDHALDLYKSKLGLDHPALAVALWVKGGLYKYTGRHGEGRSMLLRAHELTESNPQFDPEISAYVLMDIGLDHIHRQENLQAVRARLQALELFEQIHGPDHWTIGMACQGIGFAFHHLGEIDSARAYYERARTIFLNVFGPKMTRTAHNMDYLSRAYWAQGRADLREKMLYQALPILEETLGSKHILVAELLLKIAEFEIAQGRYDKAVLYAERTAQLGHDLGGHSSWPSGDFWTLPLAQALRGSGDIKNSLAIYRESITSKQDFVKGIFTFVSEESKMKYLRRNPLINHAVYALAEETQSTEAKEVALQMLLAGKAVILDALASERQTAYCSGNEKIASMLLGHADICREIAEFTTSGGRGYSASAVGAKLDSLNAAKNRLESEISGQCAEFAEALAIGHFSVGDVTSVLADKSILWEFCTYWPNRLVGNKLEWQSPRYLAFSLTPAGDIGLFDLGERTIIDSLIGNFHEMMRNAPEEIVVYGESSAEARLHAVTNQLYKYIITPLEHTVKQNSHIFISADGQLQLLPFELLTSGGNYLTEEYEISYLSSGRDLLDHHKPANTTENKAIIYAAPDYDSSPEAQTIDMFATINQDGTQVLMRGPSDRTECLAVPFDPLPATIIEGEAVAKLLPENSNIAVDQYSSTAASEQHIKTIQNPPRILHIATHGYFCPKAEFTNISSLSENPLLYSGLALAGANRIITGERDSESRSEDGILTALEASGLNLVGTDLVVLSACQSGIGEVINAEGIYGLRRAFHQAGAESIIMSLFDVPDEETMILILRFYSNWLSGSSKASALRKAALSVLEERRKTHSSTHPLYWGGFILVGNPN